MVPFFNAFGDLPHGSPAGVLVQVCAFCVEKSNRRRTTSVDRWGWTDRTCGPDLFPMSDDLETRSMEGARKIWRWLSRRRRAGKVGGQRASEQANWETNRSDAYGSYSACWASRNPSTLRAYSMTLCWKPPRIPRHGTP